LLATGGTIDRLANAVCFTCTSLTARSPEPLSVQADGDIVASLPVELSLHPEPIVFH
jgi:diacylglycerol kinase family enzyme